MTRKLLAVLAVVALLGAGCSKGPAEDSPPSTADRDQAVKFAECIRTNGVPDFPDPNADGDYEYGVSVTPEVWTKAVNACKELQPPGTLESERDPAQQAAALEFAKCIRANGVPDFPDPVNGEPIVNTEKIPSSNRKGGMDVLNAAMEKCGDNLGAATGSGQ